MKAFKVVLIGAVVSLLAGCAIAPCDYGCQSSYYARPVYYTQPVYSRPYYARPFWVAGWHHERQHHGYY